MRILYTNFHRGPALNGHVTYVMSLARALAARHHIVVASPAGSGLLRQAEAEPGIVAVAQPFPNRIFEMFGAVRQLRRIIRREHIEIIHVNGSGDHRLAILACLGLRPAPRIVYTKHNDLPVSPWTARLRIWGGTDYVIGVCESVRAALAQTPYARVPLAGIPNGVDTAYFDRDSFLAQPGAQAEVNAWRRAWGRDSVIPVAGAHAEADFDVVAPGDAEVEAGAHAAPIDAYAGAQADMDSGVAAHADMDAAAAIFVLGSQAGTADYKGWMGMVEAVARLDGPLRSHVRIVLAGALPSREQRDAVIRSGIAHLVHFTGPLEDVRSFVAALDVGFVLSWRETISFACREMMAMGVPVIVSDHSGLPENIDAGQDGWIVACRDVDAIVECLRNLAEQPEDIARVADAARARAQSDFGLAPYVTATERVYYRALARSHA